MVAAILFSLLFIIIISFAYIFIFNILLPSLKGQDISLERAMFSKSEIRIKPSSMEEYTQPNGSMAAVMCSSKKKCNSPRFEYNGPKNCTVFMSVCDTEHDCPFSCIGFGDCVKVCTRKAISIVNSTAVVNELCNGCGKCLEFCPKNLIKMIPASSKSYVLCNAPENEVNSCSLIHQKTEIETNSKNIFQFWKRYCKIGRQPL